ncbi:MAG: FtsX-like permease family protein [Bacteroidia bacterium]|nr:FtsX-like permease family protein [Bacteroidia bacterium]
MRTKINLILESIIFAFQALRTNALRTVLSLLGVTVGIFAIISVFTVVDALERNVRTSVESLGDNVIYIQKWPWGFTSDYPWWKYWQRPLPGMKELELLEKRTVAFEAFTLMAFLENKVAKHRSSSIENATVAAVSHDYAKIKQFDLKEGRYFTEGESAAGKPLCIIGSTIEENLFDGENSLDKTVTLLGRKMKVVGVFQKEGTSILGNSLDEQILVPINFLRKLYDIKSERTQPMIMAKGKDGIENDVLIDELTGAMRSIRRLRPVEEDNFALNESKLLSNQIGGIFDFITSAGWVIGLFSVIVGGFGIANIMFVSVKERTNLIGIQKALGAKNNFILTQFLTEAVVLCLIGGSIGLFLIFVGSFIATRALDFDLMLTSGNIILGLSISAIIGVIAGIVPALMASKLNPVEAIRSNF